MSQSGSEDDEPEEDDNGSQGFDTMYGDVDDDDDNASNGFA